jgi:hypothetical protein
MDFASNEASLLERMALIGPTPEMAVVASQ